MTTVRYRHSDGTSISTNARRVLHRPAAETRRTTGGTAVAAEQLTVQRQPPPAGWPVEVMLRHVIDVKQVGRCAQVCRDWADASRSDLLWAHHCGALWQRLSYVPRHIMELSSSGNSHEAYRQALADSKRLDLTLDELTTFQWSFRFKESAGSDWMERDRWWKGEPATRVRFGRDGTVTMKPSLEVGAGIPSIRWRWGNSCSREPASGTPCNSVRVTVGGGDVPTYRVSRHPDHCGFLMQSCWVVYTAFPMPAKGEDPMLEDDALEVRFEQQSHEAFAYNSGASGAPPDFDAGDLGPVEILGPAEQADDDTGQEGEAERVLLSVGGIALAELPRALAETLVNSELGPLEVLEILRAWNDA